MDKQSRYYCKGKWWYRFISNHQWKKGEGLNMGYFESKQWYTEQLLGQLCTRICLSIVAHILCRNILLPGNMNRLLILSLTLLPVAGSIAHNIACVSPPKDENVSVNFHLAESVCTLQVIAIVTDRLTDSAVIGDLHNAASRGVPVYIILNQRSIEENFTPNRLRHPVSHRDNRSLHWLHIIMRLIAILYNACHHNALTIWLYFSKSGIINWTSQHIKGYVIITQLQHIEWKTWVAVLEARLWESSCIVSQLTHLIIIHKCVVNCQWWGWCGVLFFLLAY